MVRLCWLVTYEICPEFCYTLLLHPPSPLILSVRHSLNYRFFGRYVLLHQGIVFRSTVLNRLCSFLPWVPPLPTPTGAPPLPRQNFKVATLRGYTVISFMTNRHTMCFIRCFKCLSKWIHGYADSEMRRDYGSVYMRKLAPVWLSYQDDFLIFYDVYTMTGSFHIMFIWRYTSCW